MDGVTGLVGSQQVAKVIWNDEKVYSPKCCPLIFLLTFCFLKGNIRKSMNSKFIIIFFCHNSFLICVMCTVHFTYIVEQIDSKYSIHPLTPTFSTRKKYIHTDRQDYLCMDPKIISIQNLIKRYFYHVDYKDGK